MAIDWGSYEANSGRGMRVGVEAIAGAVSHGSDHVNITINYYTQNSGNGWNGRNDAQTLNLSLDYVGSINYTNNEGLGIQLRGTRTDVHNYSTNSYGSSPGNRSYKALAGGCDNGITPGATTTVAIPARPFAAPDPAWFQSANYVNDSQIRVQWLNQNSAGQPYDGIYVYRSANGGASYQGPFGVAGPFPNGGISAFTDSVGPNQRWLYLIRAFNSVGSADAITNTQWTSPGIPGAPTRTVSGTVDQVITWTNSCSYPEYQTEVWRSVDGTWSNWRTVAAGVTTTTDAGTDPTKKYKYRLRTKNTEASALYSEFTAETTETSGTVTAPAAPTGLVPNSVTLKYDPTGPIIFSWVYNPTDGYPQSKYEIQYREVGGSTWTSLGQVTSTGQQATVPAGTFLESKSYEWQVRTWAVSATAGAWSATATFNTTDPIPVRYPLYLNTTTGQVEADSTGAGPGGGGAAYFYEQTFSVATDHISVTHNKNTKGLDLEFWDNTGVQRFGDVTKPDANTIVVDFAHPMTGTLYVFGAV